MSEVNKQLVRRWFEEVWNGKSESAIEEMLSPEGKAYDLPEPGVTLSGHNDFKSYHRTVLGAFPDLAVKIDDLIADGDRAAVRFTVDATHLGDHLGIPATGKKAQFSGAVFIVVRDGVIVEGRNFVDLTGLMQRLQRS